MVQLPKLLLAKTIWACFLLTSLFLPIYSQEILTTLDRRSLKGKIDPENTKPLLVEIGEGGHRYGGVVRDRKELVRLLDEEMDKRMPTERIVFLTTSAETPFRSIVDLLMIGRTLDVDDFTLAGPTSGSNVDPKSAVRVKIVLGEPEPTRPKPPRRFLGVAVRADGSLSLNAKSVTDSALIASLKQALALRKKNRVYIVGSREVEKTVFVRATLSTKFEHVLKTLKAVESSGARPIALEIDWLDP